MVELAIFNFILYHFQQVLLTSGLIFHCWESPALRIFGQWASQDGLYVQYVNIGHRPSFGMNFQPHLKGQFFRRENPVIGVFLDLNCAESTAILNASSSYRLFNEHFHWVLYERSGDIKPFRKLAKHTNFYISSDVTYVLREQSPDKLTANSSNESHFTLYDVYNNGPHIGGKLNVTADRRIICTETKCLLDRYLSSLYKRLKFGNRNSQRDITLRVATVIASLPLSTPVPEKMKFLYFNNQTHIDAVPRFGFRQTIVLLDSTYAKYNLTFFDRWGIDDVFGGSLQSQIDGRTDLSSVPAVATTSRMKHFQVIAETAPFRTTCLFRTPRNSVSSRSGQAFLNPFSPPVWIAFGIILLISAIQLWIMFFVEYHRMPKNLDHAPSLLTSCLITFGTACIQGSYVQPSSIGGRATYTVLAFATFIMFNYYTSIIVSTLLGSPAKSDIKTVDQLADSSLQIGFEPKTWIYTFLNSSKVPAVRRLVRNKIEKRKNPLVAWVPSNEAILRVRDEIGTFAYVFELFTGSKLIGEYFNSKEICDLNEVKIRPETSLAYQLPKNSTFKELIRLRLLRILETGINRRLTKYWLPNRLNCFPSNTVEQVSLGYTAPVFLLMLLSFLTCLCVLLLEILYNRFGNRRVIESLCLT